MPNSNILYFHYSNDKWQNILFRYSSAEVEGGQVIEPLILPESLDINLKQAKLLQIGVDILAFTEGSKDSKTTVNVLWLLLEAQDEP